jgi:hypothetical protein
MTSPHKNNVTADGLAAEVDPAIAPPRKALHYHKQTVVYNELYPVNIQYFFLYKIPFNSQRDRDEIQLF